MPQLPPPDDGELDRGLAAARPVVPAGFVDAVMRRAADGANAVEAPRRRSRPRAVAALALATVAAGTLVVLWVRPPARPSERTWRAAAGASLPADGRLEAPPDRHLRIERTAGGAIELGPGAVGFLADNDIHLEHGRVRLEGAVAVTTPRARVVGIAEDALAEIDLDDKENAMISKTATALAAAAAGTVLTVAVIRGQVDVRPPAPSPTLAMNSGERVVLGRSEAVAATPAPMSRPAAPVATAAGAPASECAGAAASECEGQPCSECEGQPPCDQCDVAVTAPAGRVKVTIDGAPVLGAAGARVTIVEFADYQCPFCERAMSSIHELVALYPNDVRVVLKNFPMPGHKNAHLAAQAALAAGEQGKYWEMHDLLLANQEQLDRAAIDGFADTLGLDRARFRRAVDDGRFAAQVDRDIEEAKAIGLKGVPSFVINGRVIIGARPRDELVRIVDEELAAPR